MTARPTHPIQIMVIEDDELIRTILTTFLSIHGYRVTCAVNGAEALDMLRDGRDLPSLIFLDLAMPVMSGREFRAAQLDDPYLCDIPVVVVSAFSQTLPLGKADQIVTYLPKPLDYDLLLATVEQVCQKTPVA